MKSIAVFCGSGPGNNPEYFQMALEVGREIATYQLKLIYGGAQIGLMGALAQGVLELDGQVLGVMPTSIMNLGREIAHPSLTEFKTTQGEAEGMHARKLLMFHQADAILVLPGGMGTMDEMCEMLTWAQLAFHCKPFFLFNFNNFYKNFLAHIELLISEGFMNVNDLKLFQVIHTKEELFHRLKSL